MAGLLTFLERSNRVNPPDNARQGRPVDPERFRDLRYILEE
jgi:hypothetical protein